MTKLELATWPLFISVVAVVFFSAISGALGPDVPEAMTELLGALAFTYLLLSFAMRPVLDLLRWQPLALGRLLVLRRAFALQAFCLAVLHFLAYIYLLNAGELYEALLSVAKRPYISLGGLAVLLMLPLVVTSTKKARRRMAGRWQKLHYLVYPVCLLVFVHGAWSQKLFSDFYAWAFVLGLIIFARFCLLFKRC